MTPHILCLDYMNLAHRARSGFTGGDHFVVYNFMRGFRALVEQHKATRIYVVQEGTPFKKLELLPTYKANRVVEAGSKKETELRKFHLQSDEVSRLLCTHFPVSVVRHSQHEADDTVYNLIKRSSVAIPWTLVSTDTDFIQLLGEFKHVRLYNPVKKTYVEPVLYDYARWKALRGDNSDNVPNIAGVGDVTATTLINDPQTLERFLSEGTNREQFERNLSIIGFKQWSDEEMMSMTSSAPTKGWDTVKARFNEMGFKSMTKDGTWDKFTQTFEHLWP